MFNETWEHIAEGEETWIQFAQRIKPYDGEIFIDVAGLEWEYEAQEHCFRLIDVDNCQIKLNSEGARCLPCVLIDPIAEEKKND